MPFRFLPSPLAFPCSRVAPVDKPPREGQFSCVFPRTQAPPAPDRGSARVRSVSPALFLGGHSVVCFHLAHTGPQRKLGEEGGARWGCRHTVPGNLRSRLQRHPLYNAAHRQGFLWSPPLPPGPLHWVPARSGRCKKKIPPLEMGALFFQSVTPAISLASHGSVNWHTAAAPQWKNHKTDGSFTFLFSF